MASRRQLRDDPREAFFDAVEDARAGMLGVKESGQHLQPMSHYADRKAGAIWFITFRESDLVRAIGGGAEGQYVLVTKGQDFHADVTGWLTAERDEAKLDELWSPMAAAWFEEGREDPSVILVKFVPREAAMWASSNSGLIFGFEVARANLVKEHKPDIGDHVVATF